MSVAKSKPDLTVWNPAAKPPDSTRLVRIRREQRGFRPGWDVIERREDMGIHLPRTFDIEPCWMMVNDSRWLAITDVVEWAELEG